MNSNQQTKDLKLYSISYNSLGSNSSSSSSNLVSNGLSLKASQQILPQTLLYSNRKVDWNWVHVNKKAKHTAEDSLEDELEIISNFGESSFHENEDIENDQNEINLSGLDLPKKVAGLSGLHYRHFKQPAPLTQNHQYQPLSTFTRSSSSSDRFTSSFSRFEKESDDQDFSHGKGSAGASSPSSSTSWKLLDGNSTSNEASPSLRSEISHHSLISEEVAKEKSLKLTAIKTEILSIFLDNELDSLILPSPALDSTGDICNFNTVDAEKSYKSDSDTDELTTPKSQHIQEEKIPVKPSSLDILNAYISQFQLDIDTTVRLMKTNSSGSDPWSIMRMVGVLCLVTYGGYYVYKTSVHVLRNSTLFSEFLAMQMRSTLLSR